MSNNCIDCDDDIICSGMFCERAWMWSESESDSVKAIVDRAHGDRTHVEVNDLRRLW